MAHDKEQLRQAYRDLRESIINRIDYSNRALGFLSNFDLWQTASRPMIYVSTKFEINTKELLVKLLENNRKVLVPYCDTDSEMYASPIVSWGDLTVGRYGILEPALPIKRNEAPIPDVVLIPGVVFDKQGNRIGQGRGYYDRYLNTLPTNVIKIGYAFSCQIYDGVLPHNDRDIQVNYIISEKGVISCD